MRNNLIFKLFSCFIALVLIPVILLNISILMLIGNIKAATMSSAVSRMSQSQFYLNQVIGDSIAAVQLLSRNSALYRISLLDKELSLNEYGDILRAGQVPAQTVINTSEAFSIDILFHKNDILLTSHSICSDLEKFYGKNYQFGTLEFSELKRSASRSSGVKFYPFSTYTVNDMEESGILYTTPLTEYATSGSGSSAFILIKADYLDNLLSGFEEGGGTAYLMDSRGTVLYQVGDGSIVPASFPSRGAASAVEVLPDELYGADNYSLYSETVLGLQLVAVIPKQTLFLQVNDLSVYAWILNGATLLMCAILSIMVATYNSRQINRTLAYLPDFPMGQPGTKRESIYTALQTSIGNLVTTNTSLQNALKEQQLYARSVLWEKITSSDMLTKETAETLCRNAGMEMNADAYCVLLMVLRGEDEQSGMDWHGQLKAREHLLTAINQQPWLENYACNLGVEQTVLLYRLTKDETANYQAAISNRLAFLRELRWEGFTLTCVGSNLFTNPSEISPAYLSCRNLLNILPYCQKSTEDILWCEDASAKTEDCFYFQDELKSMIAVGIKTGQKDIIKSSFHKILDDNFLDRQISAEMRSLLIAKLKITLMEAYDANMETPLSQIFEKVDSVQTDATLLSFFLRTSLEMSEYYAARLRTQDEGLRDKITAYINQHFCDYSFCLASAASCCALSESYFSLLFKETFGETFSAYVERKRMSYAQELLQTTDLTVDSISEKIGYGNSNAFRKAFKRYFGSSPIQIRQAANRMK